MKKIIITEKCSMKTCVNNEKNRCELSEMPHIFNKIIHLNKLNCPMFDDNPKKTAEKIKQAGGILGLVLRKRQMHTEQELIEIKKEKRKHKKENTKDKTQRKDS
jgi:hypothetical protein